jgi:hypothetical protein
VFCRIEGLREVCLFGTSRCRGTGVVLGVLGISEEQVCDTILEGKLMACSILHYVDSVCSVM